jgi:hypothetical protein
VHFEYVVRTCVLHRQRLPSGIQGAQAVFKARKWYSQHTSGIPSIQVVLKAIERDSRIHRQCIVLVKTVFTVYFEYVVHTCVLHSHRLPSGIQSTQAVFKAPKRYSKQFIASTAPALPFRLAPAPIQAADCSPTRPKTFPLPQSGATVCDFPFLEPNTKFRLGLRRRLLSNFNDAA